MNKAHRGRLPGTFFHCEELIGELPTGMVTLRSAFPLRLQGLIALLMVFLPSCKESEDQKVKYQEISEEETKKSIQRAFVEGQDDNSAANEGEFRAFFEELSKATQSEEAIDPERFVSIEAMMSALKSAGSLDDLSKSQQQGFERGFRSAIPKLADGLRYPLFDRFKIGLIENLSAETKLVYVRLYDSGDNIVNLYRYWMVKTPAGWRTYDFEDLSIGLRTVSLMSLIMTEMLKTPPGAWVDDYLALSQQIDTADFTDPDDIEASRSLLAKLRENQLPAEIKEFASSMMISVHTMANENELALQELEAAEDGGYTSPLHLYDKGKVMANLERHEEAVALFEKYMAKFGRDSDTLEFVSDSHLALGNEELARKTALEGLGDNPQSVNCLVSLAAATPVKEMPDPRFIAYFGQMPNPEEAFEVALDYLIDLERKEQAIALFAVFRKQFPESELIEYYEETFQENE